MLYIAWKRGLPRILARFVQFLPIKKRSFNLLCVFDVFTLNFIFLCLAPFTSFSLPWQGARSGTSTPKEEAKNVTALKLILNEKETKILQLETEIVRVSTASHMLPPCVLFSGLVVVICHSWVMYRTGWSCRLTNVLLISLLVWSVTRLVMSWRQWGLYGRFCMVALEHSFSMMYEKVFFFFFSLYVVVSVMVLVKDAVEGSQSTPAETAFSIVRCCKASFVWLLSLKSRKKRWKCKI